jgi:glucose/arabinose dehydrogenase
VSYSSLLLPVSKVLPCRRVSQDRGSLAGKLLRLSPVAYRGARPGRPSIFALGLRNPQGFDWQPHTRLLVATDHGPSGFDGPHGDDEINIVRRGANYGWPIARASRRTSA